MKRAGEALTPSIAVAGAIAQRPARPGHAWVFLSYLLGLRRLGYEVLFLDRLATPGDGAPPASAARSREARWLAEVMAAAGLEGRYGALIDGSEDTLGLSRGELRSQLAGASALINVNGFLEDEELLAAARRRVYLDIDPGFAQMWEAEGLADTLSGHEDFVTVGTNVGAEGCAVPTGGRRWITTLPPVVLERWPVASAGAAFTSVGSWRGPFAPIERGGVRYGLRAHEFRRFLSLPERVGAPFEIALDIDPADAGEREQLRARRWRVRDPGEEVASFCDYERYVRGSMAEFAVAKELYVRTRGGWFSDRSASYLASGKPVLAQDTGFAGALPTGEGLLCFSEPDEAAQAAEEVRANLPAHSAAARAIAEERLDSDVVLRRLLAELEIA